MHEELPLEGLVRRLFLTQRSNLLGSVYPCPACIDLYQYRAITSRTFSILWWQALPGVNFRTGQET